MALWPGPIQRLPFGVMTTVPPTRDWLSEMPSRSTGGSSGLRERPT
jgi:hypothetical protein